MARRNLRPSHAPSSCYPSATPGPDNKSDQENRDPMSTVRDKGKGRASDSQPQRSTLPTPTSDSSDVRGQKRKRQEVSFGATQGSQREVDEDEERFNKYFDPNQDAEQRREIKRKSRALERDFHENRDELLRGEGDLALTVNRANNIYKNVKQTNDATVDSRLLVNVSDLAYKKSAQLVLGDTSTGVDVDEFLSKCITFMRNGGPPTRDEDDEGTAARGSRRRPARSRGDDDDDDDGGGAALDWECLGRNACFPTNSRPPVPSFLLGPLSVEKKQRTQTQRRARQAKDTAGRETRPEALTKDDFQQADENGLTTICKRIHKDLHKHIVSADKNLQKAGFSSADMHSAHGKAMLRKHRLASNGCVPLFDFVVNPRSFGQTVENLFYISFLIKEGSVGVTHDDDGLPTLQVAQASTLDEQRRNKTTKHQAVFSLDYGTWQQLIEAFEVREPMIPHRTDEQPVQVGERGWYT